MGRSFVRRVPGVRPAWHAVLRANGDLRAASQRTSRAVAERRNAAREARPIDHPTPRTRLDLARLEARNRLSRRRLTSTDGSAVVSMTTHGERLQRVYVALESIGRGSELPGRLILWLDEPASFAALPRAVRRLQRRGLEVRLSENYRVHTKYYPYIIGYPDADAPLVTADDDIVYPADWLRGLTRVHRAHPEDMIAYRAHRMVVEEGGIGPYAHWKPAAGLDAHPAFFGTSVSGQVFPASLLAVLRQHGEEFREISPDNDDIWIHALAVDSGFRLRLVDGTSTLFPFVPKTQATGLYLTNYWDGGNDRQIRASYSRKAIEAIAADGSGEP